MTDRQTPMNTIGTPHMRRQLRMLAAAESTATELLQNLSAEDREFFSQPGAALFRKNIFILEEGSSPVPDGQSLAYFELVQKLWFETVGREPRQSPSEFLASTLELIHHLIIEANVVERRLTQRLEAKE